MWKMAEGSGGGGGLIPCTQIGTHNAAPDGWPGFPTQLHLQHREEPASMPKIVNKGISRHPISPLDVPVMAFETKVQQVKHGEKLVTLYMYSSRSMSYAPPPPFNNPAALALSTSWGGGVKKRLACSSSGVTKSRRSFKPGTPQSSVSKYTICPSCCDTCTAYASVHACASFLAWDLQLLAVGKRQSSIDSSKGHPLVAGLHGHSPRGKSPSHEAGHTI